MKLYSGPLSLFTAKVRVALAEKQLDYERIEVPFSRSNGYTPKHPDVLRLNPHAQVPVVVDGDLALYDSTVINEYLDDRYTDVPLYPRDPVGKARCRQLEAAADEQLFPHVWVLISQVFYGATEPDQEAIASAREHIQAHYAVLDAELTNREFLCESFSVADIAYFLTVSFAIQLGSPPTGSYPNLSAWLMRMATRPSIAKESADMTKFAALLN